MITLPAVPQEPKMDSTLGALFLGNIIASIFYGITCIQTFIYHQKRYRDTKRFKAIIYFLWFLDSLQLAFITHTLYLYLVKGHLTPIAILCPTWSLTAQVYLTVLRNAIIRMIYGHTVWRISRWICVTTFILLASAGAFAAGFAFTSLGFEVETFDKVAQISYLMYAALGSGCLADIAIAVSFCMSLAKSRTGFKETDSMVNTLMLYSINSSALTTVCSMGCFIVYTLCPHNFIFIAVYFCISKLFVNSLLAMLNGRQGLISKHQNQVEGSITGTGFVFCDSQASSKQPVEFASFHTKETYVGKDGLPNRDGSIDVEQSIRSQKEIC